MSTRHEDNDGSDIFWPGYVDATTNLILNLLFLLTILIVAVFMFALELGRSTKLEVAQQNQAETAQPLKTAAQSSSGIVETAAPNPPGTVEAGRTAAVSEMQQETLALKQEVERLKALLADQAASKQPASGQVRTLDATASIPLPDSGLDKARASALEVRVRFATEAVAFTPEERKQLIESLRPVVETGTAGIYVEVPSGFSEAKRMGFYRAMAVRNLLLEMDLPRENIQVAVVEGTADANAALVMVRPR